VNLRKDHSRFFFIKFLKTLINESLGSIIDERRSQMRNTY